MTTKQLGAGLIALASLLVQGCGDGGQAERENAELRRQLEAMQGEHSQTEARLAELQRQNDEMREQLGQLGSDAETLQRQLAEARAREEAQRARLAAFRNVIAQFRQLVESGQLRVRIVRGKMVVELPEGVLFDSGRAELKDAGKATLAQVGEVLGQIEGREFLIAGHTDNLPIRGQRFPSNWHLSAIRGVVVARFLAQNGVPAERLASAGYGDSQPVASNETPEGRAQNRRIEIIMMPNLSELPDLSSLEGELGASNPAASE